MSSSRRGSETGERLTLVQRAAPRAGYVKGMFFGLTQLPEAIRELKVVATGALLGLTVAYLVARRRLTRSA